MTRIKSTPLYPRDYGTHDLPKGCAIASRKTETGYRLITEDWPEVRIGEEIEVQTTNHWIWRATVEAVRDADTWVVRPTVLRMERRKPWEPEEPVYARDPMPLPPIVEGQPYVLPYVGGDAWSMRPEQGKILEVGGRHYKVTHKPRRVGLGYEYRLAAVPADAHAKRPGRVSIKDLTDPNPTSYTYHGHNVGRAVEIDGEWLHVEKVQRQAYGSGEGDEIFGHITYGVGHFVPAAKAAKLKTSWEAKEKVRSLELDLRVAKQDIDYGGNPDAVPGLEIELNAARKAAGIEVTEGNHGA